MQETIVLEVKYMKHDFLITQQLAWFYVLSHTYLHTFVHHANFLSLRHCQILGKTEQNTGDMGMCLGQH